MNVVFVVTRSDTIGGSSIHIRDLATALIKRGHKVEVLAGGRGELAGELEANSIPFRTIKHLVRPVSPYKDVRGLLELLQEVKTSRPDILSLHTAKAGWLGRVAGNLLGIPTLYTPHGWPFADGVRAVEAYMYRCAERLIAPASTTIINVCHSDRELALRAGVGKDAQHTVIHNGVLDITVSLRASPSRTPPRLIMVARFEDQKDHNTLFAALVQLLDLEWSIDLIGRGPLRDDFEKLARRLGLASRVRFRGAVRNVAEYLADAQVFLLISRWEGFPRSILEAMRAALPVIATDLPGVAEAVLDGKTGYLVPREDANTLAIRLRRLISAPCLRDSMGICGRQRYEERFTFDAMYRDTIALYERLAKEAKKSAR